jgi:hypothetical protein
VPSIRTHQHRVSDCRTIENDVAAKPSKRARADEAPRHFGIASRCILVLTHRAEAFPKLDHVIRTGIGDYEPASRAEHSRRFGKVLRREDADDEIDGAIMHRPFGPHIRNGEDESRPPSCGLPRCILGDVEAETGDRRR